MSKRSMIILLIVGLLSACVSQVFAEGGYVSKAVWDNLLSSRGIAKAPDPDGSIWLSEASPNSRIWRIAVDADYNPTFVEWFGGCTVLGHNDGTGHWHRGEEINHTPLEGGENGGPGGEGMFTNPYGIAFDSLGKAYIVDQYNNRVQILQKDVTGTYQFIGYLDEGDSWHYLENPYFAAVDSANNVYVNENLFSGKISKFDSFGTFDLCWDILDMAQGVAVAKGDTESVYVSSVAYSQIFNYTTAGVENAHWGVAGDLPGQLTIPTDLEVGPDGNIFVSDLSYSNYSRIQVFSPAGQYQSQYIRTFGTDPDETAQVTDFFVDTNGFVYVSYDSVLGALQKHSVQIFAPIFTVTSPNGGESVAAESTVTIKWISRAVPGAIPSAQLEYSLDNGQSWQPIAVVDNTGSYNWFVPAVGSNLCRIRIKADDGDAIATDMSDSTFTIVSKIPAIVDVDPDTLNKKSNGLWITAYITLPAGYNVADIEPGTITITRIDGASCNPDYTQGVDLTVAPQIGDRDEDEIPDLAVKFKRETLINNICLDDVSITLGGYLESGLEFSGTDKIRVIERGK